MLEGQGIVLRPHSFFYGAIEPLNFWHVFISRSDVENRVWVGKVPAHGFELVVSDDDVHSEPTCDIRADNGLEVFDDVGVLHRVAFAS